MKHLNKILVSGYCKIIQFQNLVEAGEIQLEPATNVLLNELKEEFKAAYKDFNDSELDDSLNNLSRSELNRLINSLK